MKTRFSRIVFTIPAALFFFTSIIHSQDSSFKIRVVGDIANVRLQPAIESVIIHQLMRGAVLDAVAKEGNWYKVALRPDETNIVFGYVHQSLVEEMESEEEDKIRVEKAREREQREVIEEKVREEEVTEAPQVTLPAETKRRSSPTETKSFLHLFSGGLLLEGGDINKGAEGLADYYTSLQSQQGQGDILPLRLSFVIGGDLSFPLTPNIMFGLGVEYLHSERESQVEFIGPAASRSLTMRPKLQAFPFKAFVALYPVSVFYLKTGIEYYIARSTYYYRIDEGEAWQEWLGKAEAQGLGFFGGAGFAADISKQIGVFVEALGRMAKVSGFEGTDSSETSEGLTSTEKGKLYLYLAQDSPNKTYPLLFIRSKKPAGPGVTEPTEAVIDFSGLSLRLGLRIRF